MTAEEETYCLDCPACVGKQKDLEVEQGLRCQQCRTSFQEAWRVEDEDMPGFCRPCASVQHTKGRGLGARYGSGRNALSAAEIEGMSKDG